MKQRLAALGLAVALIPVGLGVRAILAGWLAKYLGVALWAACLYFVLRFFRVRSSIASHALLAVLVSWAVELFQLTPIPRALARHGRIFDLVLGTTFNAPDLLAYVAGVGLAAVLDRALLGSKWR